jgi:hypothetical protein
MQSVHAIRRKGSTIKTRCLALQNNYHQQLDGQAVAFNLGFDPCKHIR